jgi:hypothetical protein
VAVPRSLTSRPGDALLEDAILQIAEMQDPATLGFPIVGGGERSQRLNAAGQRLQEVASAITDSRRS